MPKLPIIIFLLFVLSYFFHPFYSFSLLVYSFIEVSIRFGVSYYLIIYFTTFTRERFILFFLLFNLFDFISSTLIVLSISQTSTRDTNVYFFFRHWKLNLFIITCIFDERYFIYYLNIISDMCYPLGCADPIIVVLILS